ncbi:AP-3 complex subunit delta-1-like, partial [Arapaima gigas]
DFNKGREWIYSRLRITPSLIVRANLCELNIISSPFSFFFFFF